MGHDVLPNRLMPLSLSLLAVAVNYELPKPERNALRRASGVLAGLAKDRNVRPIDPDVQMPLLARANAPSAEDREQVERATRLLHSDARTYAVGQELKWLDARWPEYAHLEGWRWLRAARVFSGPRCVSKAMGFPYFASIAANFAEADRDRPLPAKDVAPPKAADLEGLL